MALTNVPPVFIDTDLEVIKADIKALYEYITGKVLQPAQVEQLILNVFAYREQVLRQNIQDASTQNLLAFARGIILDFLADLVDVERLAASAAATTLEFTLVTGHTGVTIPQGTRVSSVDGLAVFSTVEDLTVLSGVLTATVDANCTKDGAGGNGYGIGIVTNVLDPQPYIVSATNTLATAGGAEQETDEEFRDRVKLATGKFSVAGPVNAYKYFAKSANPVIIDVEVITPQPGDVAIYPLMNDGTITPVQVLNEVYDICNAEDVRPLTDTVYVYSPTQINFGLTINVTILSDAIGSDVITEVTNAAQAYVDEKRQRLGQDIVDSQIKGRTMLPGVYDIDLPGWSDIIVGPTEFANNTGIIVNLIGSTNG